VHHSFRTFIWLMHVSGVLDYHIRGDEHLAGGQLIIGNHPSLIDVIFVVSRIPDAYCVVKDELRTNVFTRLIVHFTGYLSNSNPDSLIGQCLALIEGGATLVMFPEGGRTGPDQRLSFKRGAAIIMCRSRTTMVPVVLKIWPPTLAKGERWLAVPKQRVQYFMDVGSPIQSSKFITDGSSEREISRSCTRWLEDFFVERLQSENNYGKSGRGNQSANS